LVKVRNDQQTKIKYRKLFLSREIRIIIQKQIELQKIELDCREREIKLRERELAEREKRFNVKPSQPINNPISVNSEPFLITKPNITEEIVQSKSEIPINKDIITVIFIIYDRIYEKYSSH
jgi:hypothetical protein